MSAIADHRTLMKLTLYRFNAAKVSTRHSLQQKSSFKSKKVSTLSFSKLFFCEYSTVIPRYSRSWYLWFDFSRTIKQAKPQKQSVSLIRYQHISGAQMTRIARENCTASNSVLLKKGLKHFAVSKTLKCVRSV